LIIGTWQKQDLHYLLFIFPDLALLSANSIVDLLLKSGKKSRVATIFFLTILLTPAAYSAVRYASLQVLEDSRWKAQRWIHNNIPSHSKMTADWAYLPHLKWTEEEETGYTSKMLSPVYSHVPMVHDLNWLSRVNANYLLTSSFCFERFFSISPSPSEQPDV